MCEAVSHSNAFVAPSPSAVFVHQSAIVSNGFRFLKDGEEVAFELEKTAKGMAATNVTAADGSPLNRPPGQGRE